jgi:hypothetical protein
MEPEQPDQLGRLKSWIEMQISEFSASPRAAVSRGALAAFRDTKREIERMQREEIESGLMKVGL